MLTHRLVNVIECLYQTIKMKSQRNFGIRWSVAVSLPEPLNNKVTLPFLLVMKMVPWFPRHISELDVVSNNVFMYGKHLDADHPSFKDEAYRMRRIELANMAFKYSYGQPLPRIEYTKEERETWGTVYRELLQLYQTHACKEYLENIPLLQKYAGYREDDLPQLEDVSTFLKRQSGFTLRPVAGYISARDFLKALAFRVFYCTQYIRHSADPFYTPEPDCIHELMGHVPLLANPEFARFSQELGLASLGASEEDVKQLATLYFFTAEFGICEQEGQLRAYGAGLLSSAAELKHALSDAAVRRPFQPDEVVKTECMVTTYQNVYFTSSSLKEAQDKLNHFIQRIKRPWPIHYNAYTESIEVVEGPHQVLSLIDDIESQLFSVRAALNQFVACQGEDPLVAWRMAAPEVMP
ncbi:unnamed protein product [Mesocestoides corti]|uniref:Biopterin-dependent aromatic amino acid hydroxylase family profile domain-containing protein n=1 Tax=Mesocestoides corti TaxID=53468 RepID=A0A0R3UL90_MESCO|nr:unnamed protein product [Mesocestoides corti]